MVSFESPLLLDPTNFSPLQQTPWAGDLLAKGIKSDQVTEASQLIGESWEFSCDAQMPSRSAAGDETLAELIATNPADALSPGLVAAGRHQCDLMVKLINAHTPLSLQIHPADGNPFLAANECGKPESWLVLAAEPEAGLYLGFSKALPVTTIEQQLATHSFDKASLHFVPVKPGDFFEIAPGVPHAIGPGIIILEPQRIHPGKSGKTWRLWDWNRLYDTSGRLDMTNGKPRELHIKPSLSLLKPDEQVGEKYVATLRKAPQVIKTTNGATVKMFPANDYYQVFTIELAPAGSIVMTQACGYAAMSLLSGRIQSTSIHAERKKSITMSKGQSAFVPWKSFGQKIENSSRVQAIFSWVIPAGMGVANHQGMVFE